MNTYARIELRAPIACLLCSRTIGHGVIEHGRVAALVALQSEHGEFARRRRCPYCAGRLWFEAPETCVVRLPLPAEEAPKRGRPPKAVAS